MDHSRKYVLGIYPYQPVVRMVYPVSGSSRIILVIQYLVMHSEHIYKSIALFISQLLKRRAEILLVAVEAVGLGIGAHTGY